MAQQRAATASLTPERILSRLEWRVIRRLDGRLQGDYRTLFRGAGTDVADLREYQYGDDLRHIDWHVTARMDTPHVREYLEDRDVTAWLVLDRSPSMRFGPIERHKAVVLTEVAATIAQLLSRGGNRVGAVLFDRAVEETIPPGLGRAHVLRILARLAAPSSDTPGAGPVGRARPAAGQAGTPGIGTTIVGPIRGARPAAGQAGTPGVGTPDAGDVGRVDSVLGRVRRWAVRFGGLRGVTALRGPATTSDDTTSLVTDLEAPLKALLGIARRRSLVVIVSDFLCPSGWERPLALLARRHDVMAIQIVDRREFELPAAGAMYVEDSETGEQIFVDTDDPGFQRRLREHAFARQAALEARTRSSGVALFPVTTDEDLVRAIARIAAARSSSARVRRTS